MLYTCDEIRFQNNIPLLLIYNFSVVRLPINFVITVYLRIAQGVVNAMF